MSATIHDLASYRRAAAKPVPVPDPCALVGATIIACVTLTAVVWVLGFAIAFGGLQPPPVKVHGQREDGA